MDNSSSKPPSFVQTFLLYVTIVIAVILTVVILLIAPEDSKAICLAAIGIVVAIILGLSSFINTKRDWPATILCIIVLAFVGVAIIWYIMHPVQNPTEPPKPPEPEISDATSFPPIVDKAITPTEITPTEDGMDFLAIDEMEERLKSEDFDYFPALEIRDCRHLFLSFTEEFPEEEFIDILEYQPLILEHVKDWNIEKLKTFINMQFQESYQSVEDFSASAANGSTEIAEHIKRIEELDIEIKLARATNERMLPLYEELSKLYLKIIELAPRGEYYIQLARPYEEGILRMRRVKPGEKNAVFLWAANAVAYFRTALTYQDPVGDSISDIFYRIAKIYHYIGDMPGLYLDIRSYCYRVSAAYLELAVERETQDDTYYGYSTYYAAMVYHKLAIITTEPKERLDYLELAEQNYEKADEAYFLDSAAKSEIKHALLDIETRKK